MVGFTPELNLEDLDQASKLKLSKDPPDAVDPRPIDLSFVDSLLDFDSIENWFMDIPNPDMAETGTTTVVKSEPIDCEPGGVVKVKVKMESEISENLSCCIEEELGKVSLLGAHEESSVLDCGNAMISERVSEGLKIKIEGEDGVKSKMVSGSESESSEESESESSSASSSSSSSSDDDDEEEDDRDDMEKKRDEPCELEEGEIRGADQIGNESGDEEEDDDDVEVAWSDVDIFDEGDEEEEAIKGPIRSKNELEVLPPVPPVDVTLEPHHQMLPVGVVLSIVDTKVIVEGVEKHNPLNEGSILWITESRSPLGLVDEIFGPVINPYYMVRYNSESEIPPGIQVGTPISFVQEFADHVLNNKDLYRKGYDASGANDEEVSDEAEFSDDEKEAEYKRMQKMSKRGMNDYNAGSKKNNRKRGKHKMEPWKNGQPSPHQTPTDVGQLPPYQHHQHFSSAAPARGYGPSSCAVSEDLVSGGGSVPPFPGATQATGMIATSNGVWTNGMPCQPQQTPFPNGFPNNDLPFYSQYPHQMSMLGGMPFHQQANLFAGPMGSQGMMGQHAFHQPAFGIAFQGQPTPGQQLSSFPGPMYSQGVAAQHGLNQNAFGMVQQGQHGFNQTAFGIGQQGQHVFNPNTFGVGQQVQHGLNPNTFAMGQQGQHGFNQNTFGIGLQGQPTNPTLNAEQNMPHPPNPVAGNVDAPQQFNQSTAANRGRRPYRRGGRQFAGGRGRGSR